MKNNEISWHTYHKVVKSQSSDGTGTPPSPPVGSAAVDRLMVSWTSRHAVNTQSGACAPGCLPKGVGDLHPRGCLEHLHSSLPEFESTKMSFS